jgi:hypothetical protein
MEMEEDYMTGRETRRGCKPSSRGFVWLGRPRVDKHMAWDEERLETYLSQVCLAR